MSHKLILTERGFTEFCMTCKHLHTVVGAKEGYLTYVTCIEKHHPSEQWKELKSSPLRDCIYFEQDFK